MDMFHQIGFKRVTNTAFTPAISGTFPNKHEVTKASGIASLRKGNIIYSPESIG